MKKYKDKITVLLTLLIAILFLMKNQFATQGIRDGLRICSDTVIPSLFPFMALSTFASKKNTSNRKIGNLFSKILSLNENAIKIILFSFISGYPVGMRMVSAEREKGNLTLKQSRRLMSFCVNAGPAFILNVIGNSVFSSKSAGITVLVSTFLSSVIIGMVMSLTDREKTQINSTNKQVQYSNSFLLIESVNSAVSGIVSICSWIILFSSLQNIIFSFIPVANIKNIISVLSEVTTGVTVSAKLGGIPLTCFCVSFGGFCVLLQLYPYIKKAGCTVKDYLLFRLLNGFLSYFISLPLIKFLPPSEISVGSFSPSLSSFAPSSCILLFSFFIMLIVQNKGSEEKNLDFS